jgi:hypothetical protein
MQISHKLLILSTVSAFLFTGCDRNEPPHIINSVEVDGCIISEIYNPRGRNFFIAKCSGDSVTVTTPNNSGKVNAQVPTVTVSPSIEDIEKLKKQLAVAEAKERAMSKLTSEECKLLNLEPC